MANFPMKLLLVDGNNLAHRVNWTHRNLSCELEGEVFPTGMMFGFIQSIIHLKKNFPFYHIIVAWDSKSKRRIEESQAGVEAKIIDSAYKANRIKKDEEVPDEIKNMNKQYGPLKDMLKFMSLQQVRVYDYEADDVIYTYARNNSQIGGKNIIVSSDKDFYQVVDKNTTIYDSMNDKVVDEAYIMKHFGITPSQWVEVGALMGDDGDNIHGIDQWGLKTAMEHIKEHGSIENIDKFIKAKPEKKLLKREVNFLASESKVRLAKSLKQMDMVVDIPDIEKIAKKERKPLVDLLLKYKFASIIGDINAIL